jgi:hypothetical protein
MACFGTKPVAMVKFWTRVNLVKCMRSGAQPKHLIWMFDFLNLYNQQEVNAIKYFYFLDQHPDWDITPVRVYVLRFLLWTVAIGYEAEWLELFIVALNVFQVHKFIWWWCVSFLWVRGHHNILWELDPGIWWLWLDQECIWGWGVLKLQLYRVVCIGESYTEARDECKLM